MTGLISFLIGCFVALIVFSLLLVGVIAFLYRRNSILEDRAGQREAYEHEAEAWKANYYATAADRDEVAADRDFLQWRNTQLTSALRRTIELLEPQDPPAWMQMLAPWEAEFLTGQADLPAADVNAFIADVERIANEDHS